MRNFFRKIGTIATLAAASVAPGASNSAHALDSRAVNSLEIRKTLSPEETRQLCAQALKAVPQIGPAQGFVKQAAVEAFRRANDQDGENQQ